jgi:hypothetical protein
MKAPGNMEMIIAVITWIAFGIAVLLHLGFWLTMIFYPAPTDVPVEFNNP